MYNFHPNCTYTSLFLDNKFGLDLNPFLAPYILVCYGQDIRMIALFYGLLLDIVLGGRIKNYISIKPSWYSLMYHEMCMLSSCMFRGKATGQWHA